VNIPSGLKLPNGTFYNNNIGECTSTQVIESDSLEYVSGTFVCFLSFLSHSLYFRYTQLQQQQVWSGFDYLGEARGWP